MPATTWLRAGMPLGETARRLGHSVETLVSTYVGALDDEEQVANKRIDTFLGSPPDAESQSGPSRRSTRKTSDASISKVEM